MKKDNIQKIQADFSSRMEKRVQKFLDQVKKDLGGNYRMCGTIVIEMKGLVLTVHNFNFKVPPK